MAYPWETGDYPSQTFDRTDNIKITVTPYENVTITMCVLQYPYDDSLVNWSLTEQADGSYTGVFNADEQEMDDGGSAWLSVTTEVHNPNISIYWDDSSYYTVSVEVVE